MYLKPKDVEFLLLTSKYTFGSEDNVIVDLSKVTGQSLAITAADVTIDFILDERARELAGEYKRWLDLKRTTDY